MVDVLVHDCHQPSPYFVGGRPATKRFSLARSCGHAMAVPLELEMITCTLQRFHFWRTRVVSNQDNRDLNAEDEFRCRTVNEV
jgi:hypothetical protein